MRRHLLTAAVALLVGVVLGVATRPLVNIGWNITFFVVPAAVAYWMLVLTVRWHTIARPIHEQIRARLDLIEQRLPSDASAELRALLRTATTEQGKIGATWDILFWSRGREAAQWLRIDALERELLRTEEDTRLPGEIALLAQLNGDVEATNALLVKGDLRARCLAAFDIARLRLRKVDEAIDYHNNKLSWYTLVALAMIVIAAYFELPDDPYGHSTYILLCGALGGVLSRLTRAVRTDYTSHDLGLRWMVLFLTPLLGALAAWAGDRLLTLADVPRDVDYTKRLATALLFGFSERMFGDLSTQVTLARGVREPATGGEEHGGNVGDDGGQSRGRSPTSQTQSTGSTHTSSGTTPQGTVPTGNTAGGTTPAPTVPEAPRT